MNTTDTATPKRIRLVHLIAAESQGAYSELCDTFRDEGMGNADADTAAWALWVRYLHGEFRTPAAAKEDAPATAEQLAIMRDLDAADSTDLRELAETFRAPGVTPHARHAAASKLWHHYQETKFDAPEPTHTVTLPGALRAIVTDTDALDGLATAPGARGSLRVTGTADQLAALTDRVWVAADPESSEPRERAAYRRWTAALARVGVRL